MFKTAIYLCCLILSFPLHIKASPGVSAKAAVVIENSTGKILYEKNPHEKLPMASTTKIMTALCAVETGFIQRFVAVDDRAVGIEGSSVYLAHGEIMTMEDLIYATMLNSGNDAATAIAIEIGGSVEEFAKLMNDTAEKIGVKNTNFVNACGLYEEQHYTTAYDLAVISAYALNNPEFARIVGTVEKTISGGNRGYDRVLKNHNKLLTMYEGCIGVKTGYTKKCGRCLVSAAERDGVVLTCVTLNAPDDWNDHKNLLDYGFSKTRSVSVAVSGDYALSINVANGTKKNCPLIYADTLSYVSFGDNDEKVEIAFELKENIRAPLGNGESVGRANLIFNGEVIKSTELLSAASVLPVQKNQKSNVFLQNLKRAVNF